MIPENLKYTKEHEWAKVEDALITVGITHYAQGELGDIVFVELPEEGAALSQMAEFGVIESVKSVSNLYSPVSGEVVKVNKKVLEQPELVNDDPYGDGWLIKIEPSDTAELNKLISAQEYEKFVEEQA